MDKLAVTQAQGIQRIPELEVGAILPLDHNPAAVYLASVAEGSRRATMGRLAKVAKLLNFSDVWSVPWHRLRFQHVAAIRARLLQDGAAPATVSAILVALRQIARAAFNLDLLTADDRMRIGDVKSVSGDAEETGRVLSAGELKALIEVCRGDERPAGFRDAAVIALLYGTGARRAELAGWNLSDWDPTRGALYTRGKRKRNRWAPVEGGAADALADWLALRGEDSGALFLPVNKSGELLRRRAQRLSDQAVYALVQRRAKQAELKPLMPHDFRRSFGTHLLSLGADALIVAKLMGHVNVQTTLRYDRRDEEAKRREVARLYVPYTRRLPAVPQLCSDRSCVRHPEHGQTSREAVSVSCFRAANGGELGGDCIRRETREAS